MQVPGDRTFQRVENPLLTRAEMKTKTMSFHTGVSIRLMRQELTSGISQVCLSDIGEQPSRANISDGVPDTVEGTALVCVTNNPNCCRPVDNPNGRAVGEWTINRFPVPGMNAVPPTRIYRN